MIFTKKPFLLSFAGNPMRYILSNSSGGGGGGSASLDVFSVIEIGFSDIDTTPDHSIEVSFLNTTKTFTLKTTAETVDDLPVADALYTPQDWAQACFAFLLNNRNLLKSYDVTLDDDAIMLTAKVASPDYDWVPGPSTITGVTITTVMAGAAGPAGTVEGVLMTVLKVETSGAFTAIGSEYKPLDIDGNVKFEIQEYLYANLLQAPPPRFKLLVPLTHSYAYSDYILKYRVVFCNRIAGVYEPRSYVEPTYLFCYAIAGGLNREDLVYNNQYGVDWFSLAATKKKFMTWSPPSRITDKVETHSLFFPFQAPAYASFKMKADLLDDEHHLNQVIDVTALTGVGQWRVVEFMAGYTQLGLDAYLGGNVNRWQLYLVDNADNVISDIREFSLDPVYHENIRYFRFRNSWGVYESLRCTGDFETIPEHDREQVVFISDEVETPYNTPGNYTMIKETQTFKANSGWLSRDYLNFLRDFMLSFDIYEVEDGRLLRSLLTSKKTNLFKDKKYNYSLEFEYKRGYDDFFFQISE
jgi:hypothetical protein